MAISYHTGIPFSELADLPDPILEAYFELMQQEAEAIQKARK